MIIEVMLLWIDEREPHLPMNINMNKTKLHSLTLRCSQPKKDVFVSPRAIVWIRRRKKLVSPLSG